MNAIRNCEKAEIIDALRKKYRLEGLLEILNRSTIIRQLSGSLPVQAGQIRSTAHRNPHAFYAVDGRYGYRRIHASLKNTGVVVSEKVVHRLMKEDGLQVQCVKQKKYSSYIGEIGPAEKWLADITEFNIPTGKVYLSSMIDYFDGLVVSWSIGTSPSAELVNGMLDQGISRLHEEYPIVHSDRGSYYRWAGWIERMKAAGLIRSMSKKGCSPDNSACEGFFGRLKNEMFYGHSWKDISVESFMAAVNK